MDALAMKFANFDLSAVASLHEDAFPDLNPVDLFRCAITATLANLTGVDSQVIYPALSWTNTLDKGDLLLAVPRLGIKGIAPAQKALELAKSVSEKC